MVDCVVEQKAAAMVSELAVTTDAWPVGGKVELWVELTVSLSVS